MAAKSDSINIKKKTPPNNPTFNCNTFILHGKKNLCSQILGFITNAVAKVTFFLIKITVSEAFF